MSEMKPITIEKAREINNRQMEKMKKEQEDERKFQAIIDKNGFNNKCPYCNEDLKDTNDDGINRTNYITSNGKCVNIRPYRTKCPSCNKFFEISNYHWDVQKTPRVQDITKRVLKSEKIKKLMEEQEDFVKNVRKNPFKIIFGLSEEDKQKLREYDDLIEDLENCNCSISRITPFNLRRRMNQDRWGY